VHILSVQLLTQRVQSGRDPDRVIDGMIYAPSTTDLTVVAYNRHFVYNFNGL